MTQPLAIVQARMASKRLPGKMLLPLGGHPLIYHAWRAATVAFGEVNVIVAMPASSDNDLLAQTVEKFGGKVYRDTGAEDDVLGRFYRCATQHRWHPDSVIVRVTPDDPFKNPAALKRVAQGERLPVEIGGEAFTLGMLETANELYEPNTMEREHITHALFATDPPPCPPGTFTVDTQADYERAQAQFQSERPRPSGWMLRHL